MMAIHGLFLGRSAAACAAFVFLVRFDHAPCAAEGDAAFPVVIRVDAAQSEGPLRPIWRFFGADEPNYATMPHGEKLLGELGELAPEAVYFRTHNLLTSGDGTPALKWGSSNAYREDAEGRPIYDWTILDGIFDSYRRYKLRPLVQLGFMPRDLSTHPEPYQHHWNSTDRYSEIFTGWSYPPKDFVKWADLVHAWTEHCVERYGADEVAAWYWETWNEPNSGYWRGSRDEYFKLHDYSADAVRRALPTARIGGPHTAGGGGEFLRAFLEHCLRGRNYATGQTGTPLDFIAFHAKGAPRFVEDADGDGGGHVRMGIAEQLRTIDDAFAIVAEFPELRNTPIILGESDPEGCAACQGPQLAYRNGTMYSSYTAASFARKHQLAAKRGVNLEGAVTWAFEFEGQPYFAGFRSLATNGIDKPVLNVFRMFARMSGDRLPVASDAEVPLDAIQRDGVRGKPDVSALASRDADRFFVMAWHYHDDDLPGPPAEIDFVVENLPRVDGPLVVTERRIDSRLSNAYATWLRMGSPQEPTAEQYAELESAGKLQRNPEIMTATVADGAARWTLVLPRQAVSLLEFHVADAGE